MSARVRRRVLVMAGLVTAAALPLTGCVTPFGTDDASTSRPAPPSPGSSSPSPTSDPDTETGRVLTDAEAGAALPARPTGTTPRVMTNTSEDRTTDPPECLDVLRIGSEEKALRTVRVGNAGRSWTTKDPVTTFAFSVESYSRLVGPAQLDRAGAAMGACDAFSLTGRDADGSFDLRVLAEPRAVSSIGEQNFAARIISFNSVNGKSQRVYLDYVVVRSGHNLIEANATHQDESRDFSDLEAYVTQMLTELEE